MGETQLLLHFFCQVGRLAGVVQDVCERTSCTVVLDMGSGLVSRETQPEMLASVFIHWPSHRPLLTSSVLSYCTRSDIGQWEGLGPRLDMPLAVTA